MSKKTKCLVVRVDEHMYMRLTEICKPRKVGLSTIARAFILKALIEIEDKGEFLKPGRYERSDSE